MSDDETSPARSSRSYRQTSGLMNVMRSSSRPLIVWEDSPPVKSRILGGRIKSTDSQEDSPKSYSKKFLSLPHLTGRMDVHQEEQLRKKREIREQRLIEELQRKFARELEADDEELDGPEKKSKTVVTDGKTEDYDELEDYDFLTKLEEEARKKLEEKTQLTQSNKSSAVSFSYNFKSNANSMDNIQRNQHISANKTFAPATGTSQFESVIQAPKVLHSNHSMIRHSSDENIEPPAPKRKCSATEIEQKRLAALKRRELFLKNKNKQ